MIEIKECKEKNCYKDLAGLATIIWGNLYTPLLGYEQASYMSAMFQSEEAIQEQINQGFKYYSIYLSNEMIGYLSYKKNGNNLFFDKIYVLDTFRGQSIGTLSMKFIEKKAIELGCSSIALKVEQNNSISIDIFKRWGFRITDSISRDIGEGYVLNGYMMTKDD